MISGKPVFPTKPNNRGVAHRLSQLIGFLLGGKLSSVLILTFALYVSTFFLFNHEESLRSFVFDYKVHGIIFCAVLSIFAGGIINQFYDREKDKITKPFRSQLQSFLEQKYFLYAYLALNAVSLGISWLISWRVFVFFLFYQFMIWLYSHKLSKILMLNNITFIALTLYPFFGMLVYYQTFSMDIFLMAFFLFDILLIIDMLKDTLTKNADRIFGYNTIPNRFGKKTTQIILLILLLLLALGSVLIILDNSSQKVMKYYFALGILLSIFVIYLIFSQKKNTNFFALNLLRMWIFLGVIAMLLDGVFSKF